MNEKRRLKYSESWRCPTSENIGAINESGKKTYSSGTFKKIEICECVCFYEIDEACLLLFSSFNSKLYLPFYLILPPEIIKAKIVY